MLQAKIYAAIISQFQSNLKKLGILLRLVDVMNLILILSHPFNVQGTGPYFSDFVKKVLMLDCI